MDSFNVSLNSDRGKKNRSPVWLIEKKKSIQKKNGFSLIMERKEAQTTFF